MERSWSVLLALLLGVGCAFGHRGRDVDRTPVTDTGVGATILYPGQNVPMPGHGSPQQAAPSQDPAGASAPAPGQAPVTYIGGAAQDEKKSVRINDEPLYYKYALLPFALAAAPFVAVAEFLRGDEEPGPELPAATPPPPAEPPPAPTDYESARLEAIERELGDRDAPAPVSAAPPPRARGASIADELAALQRKPRAPEPGPARPAGPVAPLHREGPFAAADGIVDRDGDGRIDQWIFREEGEIVRNVLDEDGDGRPDRTLHYDRQTHRVARVDEDTNGDGEVDTWTEYQEGEIARRRVDADHDGTVDSWSWFRDDQIERHESDTTGDGFRDSVLLYRNGALASEQQDRDGDGRAERILHFDSRGQMVRREDDTDGDGRIDTVSHFQDGRLSRRELLAPAPGEGS